MRIRLDNQRNENKPERMKLAQAYVPWQTFDRTYTPKEALQKGTLFPELYRPYR